MLVRKSVVANLQIGNLYVAFSAKSKMLSSNGNKGVFVIVEEVVGKDVKVNIPSLNKSMVLKRLDERKDAWMYSPDTDLSVLVKGSQKAALFPKFTQRMIDTFEGKSIAFKPDALYKHEREGEGNGMTFYRFRGEDDKMNTFNFAWIAPNTEPEWRIPRAQRMGIGAVEVKLPPKPVSAEEQALIDSLSAAIKEFNENKKPTCTASFVMLSEKGVVKKTQYQGACHWALQEAKGVKYVLSAVRHECIDKKLHKKYITYLTNESPFKDAFLIKSAEWIWDNGYLLTGDVSAQMIAGACIATRQAWEYPQFVEMWMALAEQGIPLNVAYLFGAYATKDSNNKYGFGAANTGHTVFDLRGMNDAGFIAFIDGNVAKQNKASYFDDKRYGGVNQMWGSTSHDTHPILNTLKKVGGAARYGVASAVDLVDAAEQGADIIEDWMKKEGV
ncbi:hypothetical protein [Citrobacter phage CVT22]|uniref:Uncharacterized protein n=1 Tax=Citrobacter phage CVT22 TaxID=1622234 RepID=A0A0R6CKU5_9CAUD|nr:hypothetical protein APL39_gp67 [Citrobacter phage CVT22]AJT60771.1 hypothetical protein [Citrobacter phage CVT22]